MEKLKKNNKKILVGVLIVALFTCLGFGGYKYYEHYQDTRFENENWLSRHISLEMNSEGVYEVTTDEDLSILICLIKMLLKRKLKCLRPQKIIH